MTTNHDPGRGLACDREDCWCFPYYGTGPHVCFWRKGTPLGTSDGIDPSEWGPIAFVVDAENVPPEPDGAPVVGTWFCPRCGSDSYLMSRAAAEEEMAERGFTREQIARWLGQDPWASGEEVTR
jgi:hypothetical protein